VSPRRVRKPRRANTPSDAEALHALTECPAPWEPIDPETDAAYRQLVEHHGPLLLEQALARPNSRSWLLVRYMPDMPDVLVEWSLVSSRRESADFCELVGGVPDLSAAASWEEQWRAARNHAVQRRRAAS
jgi:hypothetical protein